MERLGYINDVGYAQAAAARRGRQGRGVRLVAAELRQKGIEPDVIAGILADVDRDAELAVATELAARLLARHEGELPGKRREKVLSALTRRGYDTAVVRRAYEAAVSDAAGDPDVESSATWSGAQAKPGHR
jgi:regulatory protein